MSMEGQNNFEGTEETSEIPEVVFSNEAEAQAALEAAVKADNERNATIALKAMESLQKAKKDKLPEELFDAMKDARISTGLEDAPVNFKRVPKYDMLETFMGANNESVGYEKVSVNGVEIMLSTKTSEPITYNDAIKWCTADGGRMPTIEELQALFKSDKAESFEGKKIWSSSMKYNTPQIFDFEHGRIELRNKEDAVNATRAVADIN